MKKCKIRDDFYLILQKNKISIKKTFITAVNTMFLIIIYNKGLLQTFGLLNLLLGSREIERLH
jgi:hypothetical protein